MSEQPVKRGRGSTTFDLPDQPLIGGARGYQSTKKPKRMKEVTKASALLDYGDDPAATRSSSKREVAPPFLARSPSPGIKPDTTEPESSSLVHFPPASPRIGPPSAIHPTTTKRSLSPSGTPSPKKVKVESPSIVSVPAAATAATSPTTTTVDTKDDSAFRQSPPAELISTQRWRLVKFPDSEEE